MLRFVRMVDASLRQPMDGLDITLDREPFIIGRAKSSNLVIALLDLSREHCKLYRNAGKWLIEDTSTTGTFVNNVRLISKLPVILKHDDVIKMSDSVVYKFEYETNDKKPLSQLSSSTSNIKENSSLDGYAPESLKVFAADEAEIHKKIEQKYAADFQVQKQKLEALEEKLKLVNENLLHAEQREKMLKRSQEEWKNEKEFLLFDLEKHKNRMDELRDDCTKQVDKEKEKFNLKKEQLEKERNSFLKKSDDLQNKLESLRGKLKLSTEEVKNMKDKCGKEIKSLVLENKTLVKEIIRLEELVAEMSEEHEHEITTLKGDKDTLCRDKELLAQKVETLQNDVIRIQAESDFSNVNQLATIEELVESELQCSICTDIVFKAQTLICGHTFCQTCIDEWRKINPHCPNCRMLVNRTFPAKMLDGFVGKISDNLSDDFKRKREQIIDEKIEQDISRKRMRGEGIALDAGAFIDLTNTNV